MHKRSIGDVLRAAAEGAEQPAPTTIFGANDRLARRLQVALRQTMTKLFETEGGNAWSEMTSTWVFRTEPGRAWYPLPPDYDSMVDDTAFRQFWPMGLIGPVGAAAWARWRAGFTIPAAPYGWRVLRGRVYLEPLPSTAETVTIEYRSRYQAIQATTGYDQGLWDGEPGDRAKAPFVTYEGHLATDAAALGLTPAEFDEKFRLVTPPAGWDSSPDTDGDGYPDAFVRKPYFDNDADYAPINDRLVEAGVTYRLRRTMGLPYAEEMADFEELREAILAKDHGGHKTIKLGPDDYEWGVAFPEDGSGRVVIS